MDPQSPLFLPIARDIATHWEETKNTGFLTLRCSLLSVGNKKFWYKVLTRGIEPCLRRPWLRGGAFSSARLVGRQWLMKLASDEKRVVGLKKKKKKKRLLNSSFHRCLSLRLHMPLLWLNQNLGVGTTSVINPCPKFTGMTQSHQTAYYYPSQNPTGPSEPLFLSHPTPTGESVNPQVLTPLELDPQSALSLPSPPFP